MNGVNLSVLFLSVSTGVFIGALVAAIVIFAAAGAFVGYTIYKKNTARLSAMQRRRRARSRPMRRRKAGGL